MPLYELDDVQVGWVRAGLGSLDWDGAAPDVEDRRRAALRSLAAPADLFVVMTSGTGDGVGPRAYVAVGREAARSLALDLLDYPLDDEGEQGFVAGGPPGFLASSRASVRDWLGVAGLDVPCFDGNEGTLSIVPVSA